MADKTVIIEIQYDTDQAIKNLNNLTSSIEGEKVAQAQLRSELEKGKISQTDYSTAVEQSKNTQTKANTERKATIQLLSTEKGSINELKANIKTLTLEKDKLNISTVEGKKQATIYTAQIKAMQDAIKGAGSETGKSRGAFAAFGDSLKNIPGPIGGIISGIMGMTKAALAFIATPIGAVIAAIGLALGALMKYFQGSEEGQNRLNKVTNVAKAIWEALMNIVEKVGEIIFDAVSKPKETIEKLGNLIKENLINRFQAFGVIGKAIVKIFKGDFKQGFKELAEGGIQAATGVTNAFEKIGNAAKAVKAAFKEAVEDTKKNIAMANQLSDVQASIDKRERQLIVEREKIRVSVAENILKSKKDDLYNDAQKLVFLKQASKDIDALATKEENLAALRLKASQLQLKINGDDKEALDAVAQAEANLISKKAEGLEARRKIEGQISDLNLKALEGTRKKVAKEVEIDSKAQEDIIRRRGEAIWELSEVLRQSLELEAKTLEEKKQLQIQAADAELARKLEDKTLLDEEIQLAQEEHNLRLAEIDASYAEQAKALKEQALQEAFEGMQMIIDATQGMADTQVTILTDVFSRLATLNEDTLKNGKDAFLALGSAASGLTSLITANHDKELKSLQREKAKELEAAGDNKEAQDAINKKYAKKESELKKKQFQDDKKKALIDAAIATALAVVKALPNIPLSVFAGVLGAINIASIASKQYEPETYAKGGIIGGLSHAQGGTQFVGSDGSRFEAERGEAMFVLKKDATAEIAALSAINGSFGGRSWTSKPASHLADGGKAAGINIDQAVDDAISRTPIYVRVGDIETGMTEVNRVKNVGVV